MFKHLRPPANSVHALSSPSNQADDGIGPKHHYHAQRSKADTAAKP